MNLLLVKFGVDVEYREDGTKQNRMTLTRLGEIPLGDRYAGKIAVRPREIEIGPDRASDGKSRLLRFE